MSLPLGAIRDANIDYRLKKVRIRPIDYVQAGYSGGANTFQTLSGSFGGVGLAPFLSTVTGGQVGLRFVSNGTGNFNTQGIYAAAVCSFMPYDIDPHHPIYVRHLWTTPHDTASQQVMWRTRWATQCVGTTFVTPSTALNVTIASSSKASSATGFSPTWSPWGAIAPIATTAGANDLFLESVTDVIWATNPQNVHGMSFTAPQQPYLMATEFAYTPRMTFGDGSRREARGMNDDVTNQEVGASSEFQR